MVLATSFSLMFPGSNTLASNPTNFHKSFYDIAGETIIPASEILILVDRLSTFKNVERTKELAENLVTSVSLELFTESEFFRTALATKELKPYAEEIAAKKSRSEKDQNYNYELSEFKQDYSNLKQQAGKFRLSEQFPDELLASIKDKRQDGTLLFYYERPLEYLYQWIIVNVAFALLCFLICKLLQRFETGPKPVWISFFKFLIHPGTAAVILLAINSWAYDQHPPYVNFGVLLIGGFICLVCWYFIYALKKWK